MADRSFQSKLSRLANIPRLDKVKAPEKDEFEQIKRAIEQLSEQVQTIASITQQNVDLLSRPTISGSPTETYPEVGFGLGKDVLTGRQLSLVVSSFKKGLSVANGADAGKVNVSFEYLGVGGQVLGNGTSVTLTADLAVSGLNGLDTGSEAVSTWYAVHVISSDISSPVLDNSTKPPMIRLAAKQAALLSTSATAPKLPPGYNRFRRVGWVYNDSAGALHDFDYVNGWVFWKEDTTGAEFRLVNGTAASTTWSAAVSAAVAVPSTSIVAYISATQATVASLSDIGLYTRPNGETTANARRLFYANDYTSGTANVGSIGIITLSSAQAFNWKSSVASGVVYIDFYGYYDPV